MTVIWLQSTRHFNALLSIKLALTVLLWNLPAIQAAAQTEPDAPELSTSRPAETSKATVISIGYLQLIEQRPPLLSNVLPEPKDSGLRGAQLAIADNNSSGRFFGQSYQLQQRQADNLSTLIQHAEGWYQNGTRFLISNMPAAALEQLADHFADKPVLIFNAGFSGTS